MHLLEVTEKGAAMAYAGETPWHNLGKRVLPDLTPQQFMQEAQLDWTVERRPMYFKDPTTGKEISVGRPALVRSTDNRVLTVVSDDWEPVQNKDAFEFFYEFVMEGDMNMHTAGSIRGGKMVWALAKVNDSFDLFNGKDVVESYLLFSNPHEYGKSLDIRFTPIRVVCNNTLTLALNTRGKSDMQVKLNHRKAFDPELVKQTLGIAKSKLTQYKEAAEFLSSRNMTKAAFINFVDQLFPPSEKKKAASEFSRPANTVLSILETQPGAEYGRGTWWQGYNAVTFASDHLFGHSAETRLDSSWYGQNRQRKLKALEMALEMAS